MEKTNLDGLDMYVHYATYMGSRAYGVADASSDTDIYAVCVPPLEQIFPHIQGYIPGFGRPVKPFSSVQLEGSADYSIYSIVHYFDLAMRGTPNIIESLFTPEDCVLRQTVVGRMIREQREKFLSKKVYTTFYGFAKSEFTKLTQKRPSSARNELIERYGYDVKSAYHVVRLLDECAQVLREGQLDLRKNASLLYGIRRGEISYDIIYEYFQEMRTVLAFLEMLSELPETPDELEVKRLLAACIEAAHDCSLADIGVRV